MSVMIDIEPSSIIKHPHAGKHCTAAKRSLPFAESLQGEYTHRVRHVTLHNSLKTAHLSVICWCGMSLIVSARKKGQLVAQPSEGRPLCATCEGRVIGAALIGEPEIDGRQVMYQPRRREVQA